MMTVSRAAFDMLRQQLDAARAEARAAQAHVAMLREALAQAERFTRAIYSHYSEEEAAKAGPGSQLHHQRSALAIMRAALAATDAEAREFVERVRAEEKHDPLTCHAEPCSLCPEKL